MADPDFAKINFSESRLRNYLIHVGCGNKSRSTSGRAGRTSTGGSTSDRSTSPLARLTKRGVNLSPLDPPLFGGGGQGLPLGEPFPGDIGRNGFCNGTPPIFKDLFCRPIGSAALFSLPLGEPFPDDIGRDGFGKGTPPVLINLIYRPVGPVALFSLPLGEPFPDDIGRDCFRKGTPPIFEDLFCRPVGPVAIFSLPLGESFPGGIGR